MIGFIFPASFENKKTCDESYESQYNKLRDSGFPVFLIDIDDMESSKVYPLIPEDVELIYRGWMLSENKYELLYKKTNNKLLVSLDNYLNSHHSPNWYSSVSDLTFEKIITDETNAGQKFIDSGWNSGVIKDYVKSLKTGPGSVVKSEEDITQAIENMKKYKGFIEGGIVINKFVDLNNESEVRFFVLNGNLYYDESVKNSEFIDFAHTVSSRHKEFFYSIDIAQSKDGELNLIEIGDGQVSDFTGWSEDCFIKIFESLKNKKKYKI